MASNLRRNGNPLGYKALELPTARLGIALAVATAAVLVAASGASAAATTPVYDSNGNPIEVPFVPQDSSGPGTLTEQQAIAAVLRFPKVADWVGRYPARSLTKDATLDEDTGLWDVNVWSSLPDAGQIVEAKVEDSTARVTEAWTGPQVAWRMARGYKGAFGRSINDGWIWLSFCAAFLLGLADFRRLISVRNLDLLVLLSFSLSLYYFNHGRVFSAMPLIYPLLLYLLGRMIWIGARGRGTPARAIWPAWVLLAATVFLMGFRVGLNVQSSNVIDVGLASIDGAQRIAGEGEISVRAHAGRDRKGMRPCRRRRLRARSHPDERTLRVLERAGRHVWPRCLSGLHPRVCRRRLRREVERRLEHLVGPACRPPRGPALGRARSHRPRPSRAALRREAPRRDARLRLGRLPVHPVRLELELERRDHARAAHLGARARDLGAGQRSVRRARGMDEVRGAAARARSGRPIRTGADSVARSSLYLGGFLLGTALSFWILLLEPHPLHAARVFWDRTFGWQLGRASPFSIWDWDEYPGMPDLHHVQTGLKVLLLVAAIAVYFVPRTKNSSSWALSPPRS